MAPALSPAAGTINGPHDGKGPYWGPDVTIRTWPREFANFDIATWTWRLHYHNNVAGLTPQVPSASGCGHLDNTAAPMVTNLASSASGCGHSDDTAAPVVTNLACAICLLNWPNASGLIDLSNASSILNSHKPHIPAIWSPDSHLDRSNGLLDA
ncbi:hypothetical protein PCANC_17292 [Puccinia coronata f. sp. avenae]|uniref:Uncharacterized protein n=1 Tax=Puccinia coronata f. sp. avenae TaxID=200324 RepID=A0A2N5UII6_9BASI|nr:hypothetical protein PCANC_17292 [Puccinia coronata f. sp. avenae]